jgi:hypothetical protein
LSEQLKLAKDWVAKEPRLKTILTKHHRTLTLLGALIVFITFVVKDGLRERLKDLVSSIESAQNVFAIRNDTAITSTWLQRLQEQVDWVAEKIKLRGTSYAGDVVEQTHSSLEITNEVHESLAVSLGNISSLMEKVPGQRDNEARYEDLNKELTNLREQHDVLAQLFVRQPMDIVWKIAPLLNDTQKASDETRALAKDVLATASEARKKREKMMNFVTWLSYVLYTLGWGLGFAGRLYGVNDLSGAE